MRENELLRKEERAIYRLRALYSSYGYTPYKVNKFEEYDLYAKNKSFLVSENLLTFTDTNGKLMALKPDVTLSIIKNAVADSRQLYKLYYNENVYRTTPSGNGFREIMQTGLEAIGDIDVYTECEVLTLALQSLESVGERYLLDISHMGFIEGMLESIGVDESRRGEFLSLFESKNIPALRALCASCGIAADTAERLCGAVGIYLPIEKALKELAPMVSGEKMESAYAELCRICELMSLSRLADKLYLDFSVVNDMSYYDGIIFKGFIDGIPDSVLSGGRYDRLLERFGKAREAIGFAVYLDKLEYYGESEDMYDVDVMLIYGDAPAERVIEAVRTITEAGESVRASAVLDSTLRARKYLVLDGEEK